MGGPDILLPPTQVSQAKTLCKAESPFYNDQVHILPLHMGCLTELDLRLASIMRFFTATSHTSYGIFSKISSVRGS